MTMGAENYYDTLGIGEDADDDQVKQAFRELAKHFHPDHNPGDPDAERNFKRVNTAYEGLKDASRRQAYNEWLAFSDRREKAKRTQWGRLAAMVFLLLLGPMAALYWVIIVGDISVFDSARERPGALVSSSQERKPGAPAAETAAPVVEVKPEPEAKPEPKPAAEAREAALDPGIAPPGPATPTPAPAPAPLPEARPAPAAPEASAAPVNPPLPPQRSPAAPESAANEPDSTQSTSQFPPVELSDAERARLEEEPPKIDPRGPEADIDDEEGDARAAARMLARLKEPDAAQPGAPPPLSLAPPRDRPLPGSSAAGDGSFSDCPMCPVMSVARPSSSPAGASAGLAISLSTITVAQWSACVSDGSCPPYRRNSGNATDPVMNVTQREASAYADWLSGVTGQPYRVVAPLGGRAASRDCNAADRRQSQNGWQWLEGDEDCEPGAAGGRGFESSRGFRVARSVRPGG